MFDKRILKRTVDKRIKAGYYKVIKIKPSMNDKLIAVFGGLSCKRRKVERYYVERNEQGILIYDGEQKRLTLYINM